MPTGQSAAAAEAAVSLLSLACFPQMTSALHTFRDPSDQHDLLTQQTLACSHPLITPQGFFHFYNFHDSEIWSDCQSKDVFLNCVASKPGHSKLMWV